MKISSLIIGVASGVVLIILSLIIYAHNKNETNNAILNLQKQEQIRNDSKKLQDTIAPKEDILDNEQCSFHTKGLPKSQGVDMIIFHPCEWEKYNENSNSPEVVQQFTYQISDSLVIVLSLSISKTEVLLTDSYISKITSKDLAKSVEDMGIFISSKRVSIDGYKGAEVDVKNQNSTSYVYFKTYYIYDKDKIITITYTLISSSLNYAYGKFYGEYGKLFESLFFKTKIY